MEATPCVLMLGVGVAPERRFVIKNSPAGRVASSGRGGEGGALPNPDLDGGAKKATTHQRSEAGEKTRGRV